jgi:hypothetical protein
MLNFQILKYYHTKIIFKNSHSHKIKTLLPTKQYFICIELLRSQPNGTRSIDGSTKGL